MRILFKVIFFKLLLLSHSTSFSQCTYLGNETTITTAITAPTCTNQTVGANGVGPGSRKIYSGFTVGSDLQLYFNSGSAVINCVQARWLDATNGAIGGWFTVNYANAAPGTYTNQTVPTGADRLEVTTGRTSWVATSAVLNYRLRNPEAITVTGGGAVCPSPGATVAASGGGTGSTIFWQNTTSGGTNTAVPSSSQTIGATGTYYYRARYNSTGCWGTEGSATVSLLPSPTVSAGSNITICAGQNAQLNGTVTPANYTGSTTFGTYTGSGNDQSNYLVGGTTSGMPANATITSIVINGYIYYGTGTTQFCNWHTLDLVINGTSVVNGACNYVNYTYNGLNGSLANGQTIRVRSRDADNVNDATNTTMSFTVNWTAPVSSSWSGGPIVSGGTTLSPIVNPTVNPTVYTLTSTLGTCSASNNVTVNVNTPPGDPTLFGPNTWYVYAYNANTNYYDPPVTGIQYTNLDNSILNYAGWYTDNTFNINTGTVFNPAGSPDDAPGYAGCTVNDDNHVFVYKRRGFPCGTYNIGNFSHDDAVHILVDGVTVFQTTACCGSNPNLNLDLGGNSTVEIRLGENGGSSYLEVNFVPIINNLSVNNDVKTCYVTANSGWNNFTVGNGRLLVSIDPGASTLGNVEVTSYVAGSPFLVNACAPLYNPAHETAVLGRRWTINPVTQPTNPVRVRLYFDQNEHTALVPLSATSSSPDDLTSVYSDLRLSKYHHPTNVGVNGSWADNCANIPTGQMSIWTPVGANVANSLFTGFDANGRYTEYLITPPAFSEFWLHGSSVTSPLAVTLSDFSASCEANETSISWTTASEQNSDYFILERSRDGYNWDEVATVDGSGTTSTKNVYTVNDGKAGEVYYRLRQFDFNGSNETFGPIYVNCENIENTLTVYPNPASGSFTVALNSVESRGESTIFVQDLNGKIVSQRDVNVLSGTNTVLFEGEQLIRGTYIISVSAKEMKPFVPVRLIIQ